MEFNTKKEHDTHHAQMHGTPAGAEMKCDQCGYLTRDTADMESHKRIHVKVVV